MKLLLILFLVGCTKEVPEVKAVTYYIDSKQGSTVSIHWHDLAPGELRYFDSLYQVQQREYPLGQLICPSMDRMRLVVEWEVKSECKK